MTEPAIESDRTIPRRRWHWWSIALLTVVLLAAAGAALWSRQSTTAPPPAPTSVGRRPATWRNAGAPRHRGLHRAGRRPRSAPRRDRRPRGTRSTWRSISSPTRSSCSRWRKRSGAGSTSGSSSRSSRSAVAVAKRRSLLASKTRESRSAGETRSSASRHIKMMVIDDAVAIIMNQNLTQSAFTANREFGVVTNRPDAVQAAAAIFAADWTRGAEPDPGPLVVSPTNARDQLLALVRWSAGLARSLRRGAARSADARRAGRRGGAWRARPHHRLAVRGFCRRGGSS